MSSTYEKSSGKFSISEPIQNADLIWRVDITPEGGQPTTLTFESELEALLWIDGELAAWLDRWLEETRRR